MIIVLIIGQKWQNSQQFQQFGQLHPQNYTIGSNSGGKDKWAGCGKILYKIKQVLVST